MVSDAYFLGSRATTAGSQVYRRVRLAGLVQSKCRPGTEAAEPAEVTAVR
ncbi:hypothetical protein PJI17_11290 [Mycobacterium kansasii]|nr:hypothetical protein MKSMC1_45310 [Mycobacterium kansasii]